MAFAADRGLKQTYNTLLACGALVVLKIPHTVINITVFACSLNTQYCLKIIKLFMYTSYSKP